jgi:four helix bundle protein
LCISGRWILRIAFWRLRRGFRGGICFLADQLNRAAVSIAANLAEGNGRFTKPDRKPFFAIARGSAQECVPLLELAARRSLLKHDAHVELRGHLGALGKMISGLMNELDKRAKNASNGDIPAEPQVQASST